MKIEVKRSFFGEKCTVGKMFIDGADTGIFTLEDKYRQIDGRPVAEWKIDGETAIPKGAYKLIVNMSNRFKFMMPLLLNVEGFQGVRVHNGNTSENTEGCLLVGMTWDGKSDFIGSSKIAFAKLMQMLENQKDVTITIS